MIFEDMTAVPTCKSHELKRLPGRDVVSVGEGASRSAGSCG